MTRIYQKRNNNFNLLRLILALLVILAHSPELIDGNRSRELLSRIFHTVSFGDLAVDGFFVLSGYLIVQSWENAPRVLDFLRSRILRIYPAFIVATLVCIFIVGPLAADPASYFSHLWVSGLIKGTVLLQSPALPPIFAGTHYPVANGAMWTISYEFLCYLGVLLLGILGVNKRRILWAILALLVSAVFFLRHFSNFHDIQALSHPMIRLGSFYLVGGLFYLFRDNVIFGGKIAIVAAMALLIGMFSFTLSQIALLVAGSYLLFYVAFKPIAALAGFNNLPDVSYGVYLYGWPVQKLLLWYEPGMSPWVLAPISAILAIVCGTFSWYVVEKPFLKFKRKAPRDNGLADSIDMGKGKEIAAIHVVDLKN